METVGLRRALSVIVNSKGIFLISGTTISGTAKAAFAPVRRAFEELFADYAETGAGVAVSVEGELVVDLWGGYRDKAGEQEWQRDTRCNIFSASKALLSLAILQLVDHNKLSLDAPIADYWPEFACNNKEKVTVGQVLNHRSGLNAFHNRVADDIIYDWPAVTEAVAVETPWWEPGSEQGYSPMLFGWILGEVVRRVSGYPSYGEYLKSEIAAPVGASLAIGIPLTDQAGLADMGPIKRIQKVPGAGLLELMRADPRGMVNRAFTNPPTLMAGTNGERWRSAQIPAANVHASARDLALVYGSLANTGDEGLLRQAAKPFCWTQRSSGLDKTLNNPVTFCSGFMQISPAELGVSLGFGHPGAGGALGFGDAGEGIGFGFVSRSMGQAVLVDERAEHLLKALYGVLRGTNQ